MEKWKVNGRRSEQREYWDIKQNGIIKDGMMMSVRRPLIYVMN
jgi:hypothetical protein